MKKYVMCFIACMFAGSAAFAQTPQTRTEVESNAIASADNKGVIGAIYNTPADTTATVHQTFSTQTIKNTPSVSGSPLTSSNDTCMGSASGSANVPGIGLSFGKTYTDDNCVMLKNSRELWNMGMKAASMALMCMDKNNRDALEITGYVCPQSARTQASAKAGEPTDPYIRARMGLPALKE